MAQRASVIRPSLFTHAPVLCLPLAHLESIISFLNIPVPTYLNCPLSLPNSQTQPINMPLIDADTPPQATEATPHYVVYFASGEPSWCPDCRDAVPALQAVFGKDSDPTAHLVRVGSRDVWRTRDNKYRQAPYNIQGVPTVVRIENVGFNGVFIVTRY